MCSIRKIEPASEYPPEEGCYLRGNDYSPVAVVVILRWMREEIQALMERIKKTAEKSKHLSAEAEKDGPKKDN